MSAKQGYQDKLYYPHSTVFDGCNGYYLSSPSADSGSTGSGYAPKFMIGINYKGDVGTMAGLGNNTSWFSSYGYGLRPLVHLKSGVKVKPQGTDFVLVSE